MFYMTRLTYTRNAHETVGPAAWWSSRSRVKDAILVREGATCPRLLHHTCIKSCSRIGCTFRCCRWREGDILPVRGIRHKIFVSCPLNLPVDFSHWILHVAGRWWTWCYPQADTQLPASLLQGLLYLKKRVDYNSSTLDYLGELNIGLKKLINLCKIIVNLIIFWNAKIILTIL